MKRGLQWQFADCRLDPDNAQLWRGGQVLKIKPKAFDVLLYLVERAGQLVTKDDFFTALWPGIVVGDAVLQLCLSEIRKALGDNPTTPRFIETVHRRGYRFIAPLITPPQGSGSRKQGSVFSSPPSPDPQGEAEACFRKAITIAQHQHAKSLELRATMSLARLWHEQGKGAEAHRMLSAVYDWFTEGFDTADLEDAKALVAQLTPGEELRA
jgi:DNA-binding winged helix-turn-helix (wHTH) protein